jgi:hypothetical protein
MEDVMTKRRLRTLLSRGTVGVAFTKVDGSERFMRCTKSPLLIPKKMRPKHEVPTPMDIIRVFDEESNGWRSFHFSSVKRVFSQTRNGGLLVEEPGKKLMV